MASDLKIIIDGVRLNVRVGALIKYQDKVLIEISKVGLNSVIPGGRIKINEKSSSALVREMKEETGITIKEEKLNLIKTFENFFCFNAQDVHEIYFLYEYKITDEEFTLFNGLDKNKDNENTYFSFVNKNELEKYNLLPLELYEFIQK